ncbi:protein nirf [Anaeramoeba ignava]|uniref:Protein nirf n=1 Tax=Anaeramoeba ignava TaxID=1746090 RepID=A0A9Q0L9K6_ANAIG|nr:protein nirf [Anaeramoeba ignava]
MKFNLLFVLSLVCCTLLVQSQITEMNSLNFTIGMDYVNAIFIDEDAGLLYFLDQRNNGDDYIWTYDRYTLDILNYTNIGVYYYPYRGIDTQNKLLYLTNYYGQFIKFDLTTMEVVSQCYLSHGIPHKVELDLVNQKAYIGDYYPYVTKVDLSSFTQESVLTLVNYFTGSVIDVDNGILYAATDSSSQNNATLHKIDLSTFTEVNSILVNSSGIARLKYGVIDSGNQMMYFGTDQYSMNIVKINLTDFTLVDSTTISSTGGCYGAGIDTTNGLAYFFSQYGNLMKLNLTSFTSTGSTYFHDAYYVPIVFDSSASNAYLGLDYADVMQINLPALTVGNRSDSIVYTEVEFLWVDEINQILYLYFGNVGGIIVKIDITSFSLVDYLVLGLYEEIDYGAIDSENGFIYIFLSTGDLDIAKIRLSNFTLDGIVTLETNLYVDMGVFDTENQILYLVIWNSTDYEEYLVKMSCPNLEIIQSFILSSDASFDDILLDSSRGYLYMLIYDYYESEYFINQYQASTFNQVGQTNLTEYNIGDWALDKTHQFIYFFDWDNYATCRINLNNMQVVDCLDITMDDCYSFFITSGDSYLFMVIDFYNSTSDEYEGALVQIQTSSNQLVSFTPFDYELFYDYESCYDPTTNYGYLIDYYSTPVTLYQLSFPPPIPNPSSSQQTLFSFFILGIMMMILGFF